MGSGGEGVKGQGAEARVERGFGAGVQGCRVGCPSMGQGSRFTVHALSVQCSRDRCPASSVLGCGMGVDASGQGTAARLRML
eukprot:420119-Rhodomonas_salina.1